MRNVTLADGTIVPALGLGTWMMGDDPARRREEVAALRTGIELGMRLIDTAEMYGDGAAEELVGEAIAGQRDKVFLVSKVLPQNAGRAAAVAACERSLRRLGTDSIDLYLLHWRGSVPLEETLEAFLRLKRDGKIRRWGVSNFDLEDMKELSALDGAGTVATDQVLYNLTRRGIEYDLLPWCAERRLPVMAYSPLEQGRLLREPALNEIAERRLVTPVQVALAWALRRDDVIAIPKAAREKHVREIRGAIDLVLTRDELEALDKAFPPPSGAQPLEMI